MMNKRIRGRYALALAAWALGGCAGDVVNEGAGRDGDGLELAEAALDNALARTPPMGWNSWNYFHCDGLDEATVRSMADKLVSSGMKDAGYQYVVLDDCWQKSRDAQGNIVADAAKFPSGIKALADYVHGRGLKLGIYTDAGRLTCQGRPGSYGYEARDAASYAAWGVDYVKVDWCNAEGLDAKTQYGTFRDAIAGAGRSMTFSICEWGSNTPWTWGPSTGNLWRTGSDIEDNWGSMLRNARWNHHPNAAKPGAFNDPDMLEVGNGGMTDSEYRAHMSLWAVMAAPLMAGNDLRTLSFATRETLTNPEVIAVDQDPAGIQGYPASDDGAGGEVWSKRLATAGSRAVVLLNKSKATRTITAKWADLGLSGSASVRDLWARTNRGAYAGSYAAVVPPHSAVMLKIAGAAEATPSQARITMKNTDTRAITAMRVEAEFYVDGFRHYDYEDIATFDRSFVFELTGQNGSWDGSKFVGPLLSLKSAAVGPKTLTILKTDARAVSDVRVTVTFNVGAQKYTDYEAVGDLVGERLVVLNGSGGTLSGGVLTGDFLRPWQEQDGASASAELVWPNTTSRANSDSWLAANHAGITRMEPRVLVLDVVNRADSRPLDQFLPQIVDAFAEGSRHRAYADPNAPRFLEYKIDKVVNLRDPSGAKYPAVWPAPRPDGWDVGELFTTSFAKNLGYPDPNVAGRYLTMCELFQKGLVNELWISADTDRNVYENQSYFQKYDVNRNKLVGQFNKETNGSFFDPQGRVNCSVSVRMQEINTTRGEGCGTHAAGHTQERMYRSIPYLDNTKRFYGFDLNTRYGLAKEDLYSCNNDLGACFAHPAANRIVSKVGWTSTAFDLPNWGAACGNVHFPPNAKGQYDYYDTSISALSSCENYGRGANGVDPTTSYNASLVQAYDAMHGDCGGGWMIYMGQSMPGLRNQAKDSTGKAMLNWWPFLFY